MSAERAPLVPTGSGAYGAVVRVLQSQAAAEDEDDAFSSRSSSSSQPTVDEAAAELEEADRRRHNFGVGIVLLAAVVVLWTASNFVTSSLVSQGTASPFCITYLNTSVFLLYFVPFSCSCTRRPRPLKRPQPLTWYHSLGFLWPPSGPSSLVSSSSEPRSAYTPSHDPKARSTWRTLLGLSPPASSQHPPPTNTSRSLTVPPAGWTPADPENGSALSHSGVELRPAHPPPLTVFETSRVAAWFAIQWFFANYAVNTALGMTSVASATTLSSASGLFTLLVGAAAGTEHFTPAKVLATLATLLGVALVANADSHSRSPSDSLSGADQASRYSVEGGFPSLMLGDALALVSALMYALYVVYLKRAVGDDSRLSMPFFFALVGLWSVVLFLPLGLILHFSGLESLSLPKNGADWLGVGTNMFITLTSDLAYLLAMLKSSPLAATVGLSLTIPLAAIVDALMWRQVQRPSQILGDALVLLSFVGIGWTESFEATADAVIAVQQEFLAAEGLSPSDPAHPARRFSFSRSRSRAASRSQSRARSRSRSQPRRGLTRPNAPALPSSHTNPP